MDRSFLSQPAVVAAARDFACVRLATYENALEFDFPQQLYTGRSGTVENTTFGVLAPDGKTRLTRVHRGTGQVFRDAADMAEGLKTIAAKYADRPAVANSNPRLPTVPTVRLGLAVASADGRPLVAVVGSDAGRAEAVRRLAWDERFVGRFTFVTAEDAKELSAVPGVTGPGVWVIAPSEFGDTGTVLASAADAVIEKALAAGLAGFRPTEKTHHEHVRKGKAAGRFWETEVPVTDPEEVRARRR